MVTETITAQNTYTDSIDIPADYFSVSVQGTFVATVTLQRSFNGGTTWYDVDTFTSAGEYIGQEPEGCKYRIGVKTGEFTSGSVTVRLAV